MSIQVLFLNTFLSALILFKLLAIIFFYVIYVAIFYHGYF